MKTVILISGGSCSGKTTLANVICDIVGTNNAIVISQYNYFIDYSNFTEVELESVNFDIPSAFRLNDLARDVKSIICNKKTQLPVYDFKYRYVQFVREGYKKYILPLKELADIVIEGNQSFIKPDIEKHLSKILRK